MPDGIYSAASGMAAQQAWLDAIANDIANVNTDGYRQSRVAFSDLVGGAGSTSAVAGRSERQGMFEQTGEPLSVALEGPGYFTVRTPDGRTALTRSGAFRLDAGGGVVNSAGLRLEPPLDLPPGADLSRLAIAADGAVTLAGKAVGAIRVVDVPAPSGLESGGGGLLFATAASGEPADLASAKLVQGAVEASNVDLAGAMTDLIQAQRAYSLQSKVLKAQDEMLEIANGIRR